MTKDTQIMFPKYIILIFGLMGNFHPPIPSGNRIYLEKGRGTNEKHHNHTDYVVSMSGDVNLVKK